VILGEEVWGGYSPGFVFGVTCTPMLRTLWSISLHTASAILPFVRK
jgi:hypothetical protein